MKPTEQQLDNLFAAARSEEPIISQEDVRGLLEEHSTLQQSGSTIRRSLFTKKGITMTSILGTGIAAIIAFNVLVPSTDTPVILTPQVKPQTASVVQIPSSKSEEPKKSQAKTSQPMIVIEDEDIVNEVDHLDVANAPDELALLDEPVQPSAPLSPTNPLAPMVVEGVQIIKVEKEQLPSLGVEVETDGGIAFFIKGDSLEYQKLVLPTSTWGVMLSPQAVKSNQLPVSVKLMPTIITDSRGNRRMMVHKDNDYSVSMNHSHQIIGDSSYEDFTSVSVSDPKNKNMKVIVQKMIENKQAVNGRFTPLSDENSKPQSKSNMFVKRQNKGTDSVDVESVRKSLKQYANEDQIQKTIEEAKKLKSKFHQNVAITIGPDSNDIKNMLDDEKLIPGKVNIIVKKILKQDLDNILDNNIVNGQPFFDNGMSHIKGIESLVPVLIRPATTTRFNSFDNRDYDNGVIMWYPKTPELERALQSSTVPGNSSVATPHTIINNGIITNATIFPNPAKNETHVRYSLGEARSVSFTIHNILGARIADLGEAVKQSAGLHEQNISVGNIPSGIYLLVITTDKGEQTIQRIIIEH